MSFLDRASKWVSETVEKGKKEVEQMARINRIRGEIREEEKKIADLEAQIGGLKIQLGEKAMTMLRAGTLSDPELQGFLEQVEKNEEQIAAIRVVIAEKEAAIEQIKAETPTPPAAAPAAGKFCPQCGGAVAEGAAFCAQCGAKLS